MTDEEFIRAAGLTAVYVVECWEPYGNMSEYIIFSTKQKANAFIHQLSADERSYWRIRFMRYE